MPRLLPCSSCGRHVQLGTGECPFCGQVGLTTSASSPGVLSTLLLGLSLMGCDGKDAPRPADKYGAPPPTDRDEKKSADDGSKAEPTPETPRPETKYGGPPEPEIRRPVPPEPPPAADDGAKAEPVPDDPRAADKYGAPPPRDDEPVKPEPAP